MNQISLFKQRAFSLRKFECSEKLDLQFSKMRLIANLRFLQNKIVTFFFDEKILSMTLIRKTPNEKNKNNW